jgi:hypothetical protein
VNVRTDINNGICQSRKDKAILVSNQGIGNPEALVKKQNKPTPDGLTTNKVNPAHANYSQQPRPILHYHPPILHPSPSFLPLPFIKERERKKLNFSLYKCYDLNMAHKRITDKELRKRGYMTSDEFVDRLIPGLKEYLSKNWGVHNKDELHHPEDLISNASIYVEVAYHTLVDFGVAPIEPKEEDED